MKPRFNVGDNVEMVSRKLSMFHTGKYIQQGERGIVEHVYRPWVIDGHYKVRFGDLMGFCYDHDLRRVE